MLAVDDLEGWISEVNKSASLIIVEGKRDHAALIHIGIKNEVVELSKKALFEVIEYVSDQASKVIILTDLDSEGKKLYSTLKSGLLERGVTIDRFFREWLFANTKLRQIEGFVSYLDRNKP